MADIIGPAQYSQILRRENEGGTPLTQSSLAGGVNWTGVQGGYADTPQAPGGQFAEQANIDAQAFNKLIGIAGVEIKKKVNKASTEAYMRGVSAAANGQAIEDLQAEKVNGGFWQRLVPDATLRQGYMDYTAFTKLEQAQQEFVKDRERLAELSPDEANKFWVNKIDELKTGDEMHDARLMELATPIVGESVRQHAKAHYGLLRKKEQNARVGAAVSLIKTAATTLENINPLDPNAAQLAAIGQLNAGIARHENETTSEYQERLAAMAVEAAQQGQPMLFSILDNAGISEYISPEQRTRLTSLRDSAENAARGNFIKNNPDSYSVYLDRIQRASTIEEKNAIMDEADAEFQLKTGAIGASLFNRANVLVGARNNIAKSEEAAIARRNEYNEARFKQAASADIYMMVERGASMNEISERLNKYQEEAYARGYSISGITSWEEMVKSHTSRTEKELREHQKAEEIRLKREAKIKEHSDNVESIQLTLANTTDPTSPNTFRVTRTDLETGITKSEEADYSTLREAVEGAYGVVLGDYRQVAIQVAKLVNSHNSNAHKVARDVYFKDPIRIMNSNPGSLKADEWDAVKAWVEELHKFVPQDAIRTVMGDREYRMYQEMRTLEDTAKTTGKPIDLVQIHTRASQNVAGTVPRSPNSIDITLAQDFLKSEYGIEYTKDGYVADDSINDPSVQLIVQEVARVNAAMEGLPNSTPSSRRAEINKMLRDRVVQAGPIMLIDTMRTTDPKNSFLSITGKTEYDYDPKAFGEAVLQAISVYVGDTAMEDITVTQTRGSFRIDFPPSMDGSPTRGSVHISNDDISTAYTRVHEKRRENLERQAKNASAFEEANRHADYMMAR